MNDKPIMGSIRQLTQAPVDTERLLRLSRAVADRDWSEFSMRVPAEPQRDADLVLSAAADELSVLRARLATKCSCEFAPHTDEAEFEPDTVVEWCAFHADLRDSDEDHRQRWARADKRADALTKMVRDSLWAEIDTAPRDGTEILIWRKSWPAAYVAKWHRGNEDEPDGWLLDPLAAGPGEDEAFLGYAEDIHNGCMPTHWAPKPEVA